MTKLIYVCGDADSTKMRCPLCKRETWHDSGKEPERCHQIHCLEHEIAGLTGELQAYRILDAAGRVDRTEKGGPEA